MRQHLPRLILVVVAVPLLFFITALTAAALGRPAEGPAAAVGGVAFAALALAPSHQNALMRAFFLLGIAAVVFTAARALA